MALDTKVDSFQIVVTLYFDKELLFVFIADLAPRAASRVVRHPLVDGHARCQRRHVHGHGHALLALVQILHTLDRVLLKKREKIEKKTRTKTARKRKRKEKKQKKNQLQVKRKAKKRSRPQPLLRHTIAQLTRSKSNNSHQSNNLHHRPLRHLVHLLHPQRNKKRRKKRDRHQSPSLRRQQVAATGNIRLRHHPKKRNGHPKEEKRIPPKITRKKKSEVIRHRRGEESGGILLLPLEESAVIRPHPREGREGKSRVPLLRGENEGSILGRHHLFGGAIKRRAPLPEEDENQIIPHHLLPRKGADSQTPPLLAAGSGERREDPHLPHHAGASDPALRLPLLVG